MGEKTGQGGLAGPLSPQERSKRNRDEAGVTEEAYGIQLRTGGEITQEDLTSALADGAASGDMSQAYAQLAKQSKRGGKGNKK